jgi:hypothetical protein
MTAFFAALLAAIAFGTVWGWIIFVAAYIIITALVENDKGFWAFLAVILTTIALCTPHFQAAVHFIVANPGKVLLMIIGYFVIGTVWGIIKWFLYVNRQLEKYNEKKTEFLLKNKATEFTPALAAAFKSHYFGFGDGLVPQAHDHKGDILMWMTYWPFSSLWTLINDPIRKIFRTIYTNIASSLQAISDRMFKTATADLEMARMAEEQIAALKAKEKADEEEKRQAARDGSTYRR